MSRTILLDKATIITGEKECKGSVLISEGYIAEVMYADDESYDELVRHALQACPDAEVIDLEGKWLMAGGIDAHVHSRRNRCSNNSGQGNCIRGKMHWTRDVPYRCH